MELQHSLRLQFLGTPLEEKYPRNFRSVIGISPQRRNKVRSVTISAMNLNYFGPSAPKSLRSVLQVRGTRRKGLKASKIEELLKFRNGDDEEGEESESESDGGPKDDYFHMDEDERKEWRRKIRDVINMHPDVEEEADPVERRKKMQKLLADYPLVVEEEDPDWPEDDDGWGFNLGQFFNHISIKNVKKDDDENYDSDKEFIWEDDDYIRPIKDLKIAQWEETVFKDVSPLIILVHNRYKRPKENEKVRDELEKAVHIIWNCRLPSPRCVAIDSVAELDLVSALKVSVFPELIFTKAGKILYREKVSRTADELSKMMAFFYYGAAKPPCLNGIRNAEESIPTIYRQRSRSY